jgi:hypothetical protein
VSLAHARASRAPFRLASAANRKEKQDAPTGRALRLVPSRRTKDGSFLTELVDQGLLRRVTGTVAAPFAATYALTERGEYAAEYGECETPLKGKAVAPASIAEPPKSEQPKPVRKGKVVARGK